MNLADLGFLVVFLAGLAVMLGFFWILYCLGKAHGQEELHDELVGSGIAEYYIDADTNKAWRIKEKFTTQCILDENKVKEP